jgi:hypothetical protein
MRVIQITADDVSFVMKKLHKGSDVSDAKHTAEIIINGVALPCILRSKVYGNFKKMAEGVRGNIAVGSFQEYRSKYTKKGYVVFLINMPSFQIYIYLKKTLLSQFFDAILLKE